jgi:hypothetical protein
MFEIDQGLHQVPDLHEPGAGESVQQVQACASGIHLRYSYGNRNREGFSDQQCALLDEQRLLWNDLVVIHNDYIQAIKNESIEPPLQSELYRLRRIALAAHKENPSENTSKALFSASRNWRKSMTELLKGKPELAATFYRRMSECGKNSGIFWHNKGAVLESFMAAHKKLFVALSYMQKRSNNQMGKIEGNFAFRFQKPVHVARLFDESLPVEIKIDTANPKFARLLLPIDSVSHGQYTVGEFEFTLHRPLPLDAQIKVINVSGRFEGAQWREAVSFLFLTNHPAQTSPKPPGDIGIDFGWRMTSRGLRVATAAIGSDFESLHLPPAWVADMDYVADLDEQLDQDAAVAWSKDGNTDIARWFILEKMESKFEPHSYTLAWLKASAAMRAERKNKRARLERERKDIYWQFASRLVKVTDNIHIEKLNLVPMAKAGSKQGPEQRKQQGWAAISILIDVIKSAAVKAGTKVVPVEAYDTSRMHHLCKHINPISSKAFLTCAGCQLEYDPDENAALNIRSAGNNNNRNRHEETAKLSIC